MTETHMSVNIFISARNAGISPDKSFFDKSLSIVEIVFLRTKKFSKRYYIEQLSLFVVSNSFRCLQFSQLY